MKLPETVYDVGTAGQITRHYIGPSQQRDLLKVTQLKKGQFDILWKKWPAVTYYTKAAAKKAARQFILFQINRCKREAVEWEKKLEAI